jgi:hypothetical protein
MKGMVVPSGISFIPKSGSMRSTLSRLRRTMLIMIARTIETAVNIDIAMPRPMVTAKSRTGPEPNMNRRAVAISAVRLESTIVA